MELPSIISNLNETCVLQERLNSFHMLVKFLSTCQLSELEEELLQFIMPSLRNSLREVLASNTMLLGHEIPTPQLTMELKENLEVAVSLLNICKEVLSYINCLGRVKFLFVPSVPSSVADIILSNFQHCKGSQESYITNFNVNDEIVNLFRKTQEIHVMFVRWFEAHLELDDLNKDYINMLYNVLAIMCSISEALSGMNTKSMADNWKGFIAIMQKHVDLLNRESYAPLVPLKCLSQEIKRKIEELSDLVPSDTKQLSQTMKVTNFLIKVALKLCDLFWSQLDSICEDVFQFCIVLYGYSPDYFQNFNYSNEIIHLAKSVCDSYKPFVVRLAEKECFLTSISTDEYCDCIRPDSIGVLQLTNDILDGVLNLCSQYPDKLTEVVYMKLVQFAFCACSICFIDIYIEPSLYEKLLINLSILTVLISRKAYAPAEALLLQNILQDNFWQATLAADVWCLVLRNASLATCMETFTHLIKQSIALNQGCFTHRPNLVYLKIFIQRIYKMIPPNRRQDIIADFKPVHNIPVWIELEKQRYFMEPIFTKIYENRTHIEKHNADNFISLMESLDNLSLLEVGNFGIHSSNICQTISDLWEFNIDSPTITGNNFLKYFIRKLFKITNKFMQHFNNATLLMIVRRLKQLSVCPDYKIVIIDLLNGLSFKQVEYSQEHNTILAEISGLLEILLQDTNLVVRQLALEECYSFINNSPHDQIMNSVIRNLKNTQYDVNNFLQKNIVGSQLSCDYFVSLCSLRFKHECIQWSRHSYAIFPEQKNAKLTCEAADETVENNHLQKRNNPQKIRRHLSESNQQNKKLKIIDNSNNEEEDICDGEIDSLISSMKSEMKCLAKAIKKENLTKKNVSDITYVVKQLQSLVQK